jgi:hypothetical protein
MSMRLSSMPGCHYRWPEPAHSEGLWIAGGAFMFLSYLRISHGKRPRHTDRLTSTVPRVALAPQCRPEVHLGRKFQIRRFQILPSVSRQHYDSGGAVIGAHRAFGLTAGTVPLAVSNRGLPSINL